MMEQGFKISTEMYDSGAWDDFRLTLQTYIISNTNHKYPLVYMTIPDVTKSTHNYSDPASFAWEN